MTLTQWLLIASLVANAGLSLLVCRCRASAWMWYAKFRDSAMKTAIPFAEIERRMREEKSESWKEFCDRM